MYLEPRQYYGGYGGYGNGYGYSSCDSGSAYYSRWNCWGRWVACGVIVAVALIVFFGATCISARLRRRRGQQPITGTAWMAPPPPAGHGQMHWYGPNGNNNQTAQPHHASENYEAPPPQYGAAASYYGGQQSGVEMQPVNNAYQPNLQRGGDNVYAPPAGPPPKKN